MLNDYKHKQNHKLQTQTSEYFFIYLAEGFLKIGEIRIHRNIKRLL